MRCRYNFRNGAAESAGNGKRRTKRLQLSGFLHFDFILFKRFSFLAIAITVAPSSFNNIATASPTLKKSPSLCKALRKRNIPFVCDDGENFLNLPEIRLIMNLLKVIDNPMTDVSMMGVLSSPIYGFTPEDLAMLKISGKGRRIYLQMKSMTEQENPELFRKCKAFLEQLSEMRLLSDTMPLEKFMREIYEMTDLLSLQSLYENAEQRRNHLEFLAQYAKSYREHADLTAQSSLSGWIRYLNYLRESGENIYSGAIQNHTEYVSVKTIHGAKGLEYPFVFLVYSERKFSAKPTAPVIFMEENGMIGASMIDRQHMLRIDSAVWKYLHSIQNKEDISEEMRLLYVALTRAKQKLFITVEKLPKKIMNMKDFLYHSPEIVPMVVTGLNSMQEWILAYLLSGK